MLSVSEDMEVLELSEICVGNVERYWVDQKEHSRFSITFNGKTQTTFSANPVQPLLSHGVTNSNKIKHTFNK